MPNETALEIKNISHAFGNILAVKEFNIEIARGEVVCLLGPSGCGKTTALRIVAGLEELQAGQIFLTGKCIAGNGSSVPAEKRGIGLVFQDYALFPHLNVLQNVTFGLERMSGLEKNFRAETVLERVGMKWAIARYPHTLSGGQQQRVALARAIAPEPALILLDEPFSGLDARLRDQVRDESLHILKETGTAALLVTHDAEEAMFMGDQIAVMREGKIVQFDKPDILYTHPTDVFVAEFFGEVNKFYCRALDGIVSTPVGQFSAPGLQNGDEAVVVIRPEAIALNSERSDSHLYGKVLASRMLGRASLIHLSQCDYEHEEFHIHSRVPGRFLPQEGEIVPITLKPDHVFVFNVPS